MKQSFFGAVVASTVAALVAGQTPLASAFERAPDPILPSYEAAGDLRLIPGNAGRVVIGAEPVLVFQRNSVIQSKPIPPQGSAPTPKKPQTSNGLSPRDVALVAEVQRKLGAEISPSTLQKPAQAKLSPSLKRPLFAGRTVKRNATVRS